MSFERSPQIHDRIQFALELIEGSGLFFTSRLPAVMEEELPLISRDVENLREFGHDLGSVRNTDGWRHVLKSPVTTRSKARTRHLLLPPLDIQAACVDALDALPDRLNLVKDARCARAIKLNGLLPAMLYRAFRGDL